MGLSRPDGMDCHIFHSLEVSLDRKNCGTHGEVDAKKKSRLSIYINEKSVRVLRHLER